MLAQGVKDTVLKIQVSLKHVIIAKARDTNLFQYRLEMDLNKKDNSLAADVKELENK